MTLPCQFSFLLGIVVFRGAHAMCDSGFCKVLHGVLEQPHGHSFIDAIYITFRLEVVQKKDWYRIRRLEHSQLYLYIHTAGLLCNNSRNMTIIFLGLLHQAVVLVMKGFSKMHNHRLERSHISWSVIVSLDFVVIGMILIGSKFSSRRFRRLQGFGCRERLFLLRFIFSSCNNECGELEEVPVKGNYGLACSFWLATFRS